MVSIVRAVTRLASAVNVHVMVAVLVVSVLVAAVVYFRDSRRETLKDSWDKDFVAEKCRSNPDQTFDDLFGSVTKWAAGEKTEMRNACKEARDKANKGFRARKNREAVGLTSFTCKPCKEAKLKRAFPCKHPTRRYTCCEAGLKGQLNGSKCGMTTRGKQITEDSKKEANEVGKIDTCSYYSKMGSNNSKGVTAWVCPEKAQVITGINWGTGNGTYDTYQCTTSKDCKQKLKDKVSAPAPTAAPTGESQGAPVDDKPRCEDGSVKRCPKGDLKKEGGDWNCYNGDNEVLNKGPSC